MSFGEDLMQGNDRLLTTGQLAKIYAVSPKTVSRWAAKGLLPATLTPGGHHRFRESEIRALLEGDGPDVDQDGQ